MKNKENKKNVIKKRKIINGLKYYEININRDNYFINIMNLPKDELIKFTIYLNINNEINLSLKENYNIYENKLNLEYFKNQTSFLAELGINSINDLIRFLYTFFQEYNEKIVLINKETKNSDILILKLEMFHNNIQINIKLYNTKNNQKLTIDNNIPQIIRTSNSCKNLTVHKKELKIYNKNLSNKNKISENKQHSPLIMDNHIYLIQKKIPLLKELTKDKLFLIYKSSEERNEPKFHKKCDDKGPTLIFVDTEENRSFIAFNKKSWHLAHDGELENYSWRETNIRDDNIAIIDLFSQKIIELKKKNDKKMISGMSFIQQYSNYGPSYVDGNGFTFKIFGGDKYLSISFITKNNEEVDYIKNNYKLNKNNFLHIKDYEVYCFKRNEKKNK